MDGKKTSVSLSEYHQKLLDRFPDWESLNQAIERWLPAVLAILPTLRQPGVRYQSFHEPWGRFEVTNIVFSNTNYLVLGHLRPSSQNSVSKIIALILEFNFGFRRLPKEKQETLQTPDHLRFHLKLDLQPEMGLLSSKYRFDLPLAIRVRTKFAPY